MLDLYKKLLSDTVSSILIGGIGLQSMVLRIGCRIVASVMLSTSVQKNRHLTKKGFAETLALQTLQVIRFSIERADYLPFWL